MSSKSIRQKRNRVGLGTFPLGGVFSPINATDAEAIVKSFFHQGGYYIDTAPAYGLGDIEQLLGNALKNVSRENYYLITKGGKVLTFDKKIYKSSKYEDIIRECEHSLKRLQLNYIDCYMIHSPDPETPFSETMEALKKLQKDGKVIDIAVSNVSLDELKEYNKSGQISYIQNRFSIINRSINKEFESYTLSNNISLIPYHLLEIGMLTGIAFEEFTLRKGDLRETLPYWNKENQDVIFAWVRESLAPIAKSLGITIGQLNIAWALNQKFIDFIIVGTTRQDYLSINLKANAIVLPTDVMEKIDSVYKKLEVEIQKLYGKTIREFRGLNEKYY